MSKSKCDFCGKTLKSGMWRLVQNGEGKVIKVCFDSKGCSQRCVAKGRGLLSLGLH